MNCAVGQGFAENSNPTYIINGLKGHTGIDVACGFGTPIYSDFIGVVYKVLTKEKPANDGSGFTGVFMIVDNGIECFEWLIGHCDPVVKVGDTVYKGQLLGYEANHGTVFSGNIFITPLMQANGDQRGNHRHYQMRPLVPSKKYQYAALSVQNDQPGSYRDVNGYYYHVAMYANGYNGCVNPAVPVFNRDIWTGSEGYDVFVLQRILRKLGFFPNQDCMTHFGPITLASVIKYQRAHGIFPTLGYVGTKTKASITSLGLLLSPINVHDE